jgi:hypothetical protein
MKITKRQIRRIVKEERSKLAEQGLHSMSPAGKALANSIKGKFMRMYPDAKVGIDARGGFITVNGKKAVDMSQATGRGMSDDEMIEKLHAVYAQTQVDADVPTADSRMDTFREGKMKITKRQLKRIIKEEKRRMLSEAVVPKEQLEDAILNIFYVEGAVASADVYDRLRMDGYTDEEISGGISNRGGAPWAE